MFNPSQNVFGAEGINVSVGVNQQDLFAIGAVIIVSLVIANVISTMINKAM
jgi:hypothetical protein